MDEDRIVEEGDEYIAVSCGTSQWMEASGLYWLEKDYRVGGEVWRVHKNDPDPYPSRPHAHCIGGRQRFLGCKLHLGTRQLFSSSNVPLDRFMDEKQFTRLIELVRRKFPELVLPLPSSSVGTA
jgi:hypothetical protein